MAILNTHGHIDHMWSAQKVADAIGGYLEPAGSLFRVRVGPFANRGEAASALAKVRGAGYRDAQIVTTR